MKIGIIALGSHQERHGAALPPDTDARIAKHIAQEVANRTNSVFLGVLKSAYELPEIDTGIHQPLEEVEDELIERLEEARDEGFQSVLLVNAHGGNQKLEESLEAMGKETGLKLDMDSTVCDLEGPHAGTGELSMGAVIGFTDEPQLEEHQNLEKHPEVGFVGFKEIRKKYAWAEEHSREIMEEGVEVDESLGRNLLESAIESAVEKIEKLRSHFTTRK